jgi:nitrogen fixation protein FixH
MLRLRLVNLMITFIFEVIRMDLCRLPTLFRASRALPALTFFLTLFVATAAICAIQGYQLSGKLGDYKVAVTFTQTHPVEGENRVEIAITDKASRPVGGVQVKVDYFMPSFPGKPPMMTYATTAKPVGDVYEATLNLSMRGEWKVAVTVVKGKQKRKVTLPFEVK